MPSQQRQANEASLQLPKHRHLPAVRSGLHPAQEPYAFEKSPGTKQPRVPVHRPARIQHHDFVEGLESCDVTERQEADCDVIERWKQETDHDVDFERAGQQRTLSSAAGMLIRLILIIAMILIIVIVC